MESVLETPLEVLETPVEVPAEVSAEAPLETVEVPVETVEVVEIPLEAQAEVPVEVPAEAPTNKPINEIVLESPLEKVVKILGFRVSVINIQLGIRAIIAIHINCSCRGEIYTEYKELVLEGEEYTAWGSDDQYIVEIVQSKLSNWF